MSHLRPPCRVLFRIAATAAGGSFSPTSTTEAGEWQKALGFTLQRMKTQIYYVIFLIALREASRVGLWQMVYAGKHGYPPPREDDYGIAYTAGSIISWFFVCVFTIIWMPLFDWWLPRSQPSIAITTRWLLEAGNSILLPLSIWACLLTYTWLLAIGLLFRGRKEPAGKRAAQLRPVGIEVGAEEGKETLLEV
ncbi:hypothetical protein, variant [Cladophialophora immunda]|uniref:Uncharacterized protein n=1 Tax=Cladophialophora immunda TaxID=569365 RepID=A0A0D2BTU1_9EURO|nr:hypothetical protein, variant [Cladophialophora immunda]KIW21845.1 hypothetical protein, variant [Cladophialophora immunda]